MQAKGLRPEVLEKAERWKSDKPTRGMLRSQSYFQREDGEDGGEAGGKGVVRSKSYSVQKCEAWEDGKGLPGTDRALRAQSLKDKLRSKSTRYRTLADGSVVRIRQLGEPGLQAAAGLLPNTANMPDMHDMLDHGGPSSESPPSSPELPKESELEQRDRLSAGLARMKMSELKEHASSLIAVSELGPTDVDGVLDCGDPRAALTALILDLSIQFDSSDSEGDDGPISLVGGSMSPAALNAPPESPAKGRGLRSKSYAYKSDLASMRLNMAVKKDTGGLVTAGQAGLDPAAERQQLVQERLANPTILRSQSIRAKSYRIQVNTPPHGTIAVSTTGQVADSCSPSAAAGHRQRPGGGGGDPAQDPVRELTEEDKGGGQDWLGLLPH